MSELKVKYSYPFNPYYDYITLMSKVNLDEERENSIKAGQGFIIRAYQKANIRKDVKNEEGIFSSKFGATLQDANPFGDRYKCKCGLLTGRYLHGITCKSCGEKVKYVDDDLEYFGWMVLQDHYIIHPNLYKSIEHFFGSNEKDRKQTKLDDILKPKDQKDINGYEVADKQINPKDPYTGIGMIEFIEKFDEIMDFYLKKYPNKKEYYEDIMKNKDKVFTQSIPVYTTHLRPYKISGDKLQFEGTNAIYNMMSKLVITVNNNDVRLFRKKKTKNQLLYDLNAKFQELYKEIENIISGKKGSVRTLFGGRCTFTARCVIKPNRKLRIDEITIPYAAATELFQQTIINILQKSYSMSYSKAYNVWFKSQLVKNPIVEQIIWSLIKNQDRGIPVLLNRNPTINYGSITQMFIVGITETYTIGMPLQILPKFGADLTYEIGNAVMQCARLLELLEIHKAYFATA